MKEIKPGYKATPIGILPRDWEVKKLGENAIIKGRIGWKNLKQEEYTSEGPYLIAGKHIKNGIINWDLCDHITEERYDESLEIALESGDVIFSKDGTLGNPALITDLKQKATINGTMMLVRVNKKVISSEYFYQILRSILFEKLIKMIKSGSSIPHIFQRDMNDFIVPIPPKEEQEKIAQILMTWDDVIEKQEELIKQEKEFKKGMLQKIFSQKLRFKDENGNDYPKWEEKKLGEIADIVKGKQLNKLDLDAFGEYPVINGGVLPSGYYSEYNTLKNTITISEGGNSCGYINYIKTNFWAGGHCYILKFNNNYKEKYIYFILKHNEKKIMNLSVGSGLPNIQKKDINSYILNFPSLPEQEKIADFLSIIDEKIEILEKKLEELKEQKKGLMQKLLTGEVRVKS